MRGASCNSIPSLHLYRLHDRAMPILPGELARKWMDLTSKRFAYRCTPLNIANTSGWIATNTVGFDAEWDGRRAKNAIRLTSHEPGAPLRRAASSHFGHGILTFHLGWLFKTAPGWAIWARGCPNMFKSGIRPLEGIVETEWLNFPFTMNWRFSRPGKVRFSLHEPIAFMTLFAHAAIEQVTPILHDIEDNPELKRDFVEWRDSRDDFNSRLAAGEGEAKRQGWQRKYLLGKPGLADGVFHTVKRRLAQPRISADSDDSVRK